MSLCASCLSASELILRSFLLVYKALNGLGPEYLSDLLPEPSASGLLTIPKIWMKTH